MLHVLYACFTLQLQHRLTLRHMPVPLSPAISCFKERAKSVVVLTMCTCGNEGIQAVEGSCLLLPLLPDSALEVSQSLAALLALLLRCVQLLLGFLQALLVSLVLQPGV